MEPRIAYARTSDGVNIAYAVSGSGPVLISVPSPPDNHVQLEWENPVRRAALEALSAYRTLVRFDGRGSGLSDRGIDDYSIDARLRDLEAVVDRLGVERFALLSGSLGNQLTVAYAAKHPERVTHLVAVDPSLRQGQFMEQGRLNLLQRILRYDYEHFTQTVGALVFGWGSEEGPRYSAFFRQAVNQDDCLLIYDAMMTTDVTDLLPQVRCPTLVIRGTRSGQGSMSGARAFAAAVPDARLVLVTEPARETGSPEMFRHIGQFFGEAWEMSFPTRMYAPPPPAGGMRTILFTDIEGHSAMMSRLGDARGRDVLREHETITRRILRENGGHEVKTIGDSFMASFSSATGALRCAVALQRAFAERNGHAEVPVRIRIGLNAGEPIEEEDDLFGTSVIAAARVKDQAAGGQILVANVVRELVAGKGFLFADVGEMVLRGLEDPVRVYELRWR